MVLVAVVDLLVIPEKRVLLFSDFEWAAAELRKQSELISRILFCFTCAVATYLWYQNLVTALHAHWKAIALLIQKARPNCQYFRFIELLHCTLWQ